ncbi:MAG: plastocyanin/azurin family copper-binding protein [Longimicrobiales bacterium]
MTTITLTRTGFTALSATSALATGLFTLASVPTGPWRVTASSTATHEFAAGETGIRDIVVASGATIDLAVFAMRTKTPQPGSPTIITIVGVSFVPTNLTIAAGSTVRWENQAAAAHTITPQTATQPGVFTAKNFSNSGTVLEHTFNTPGQTYRYRCELHSDNFTAGMVGTITVQ